MLMFRFYEMITERNNRLLTMDCRVEGKYHIRYCTTVLEMVGMSVKTFHKNWELHSWGTKQLGIIVRAK